MNRLAVAGGCGLCVTAFVTLLLATPRAPLRTAAEPSAPDAWSVTDARERTGDRSVDEWQVRRTAVDTALRDDRRSDALHRWQDLYATALATRRWEPLVETVDTLLRLEPRSRAAEQKAREAYVIAFARARRVGSVAGMLSVADGLHAVGDTDLAVQYALIAEQLAVVRGDSSGVARARATRVRFLERPAPAGRQLL